MGKAAEPFPGEGAGYRREPLSEEELRELLGDGPPGLSMAGLDGPSGPEPEGGPAAAARSDPRRVLVVSRDESEIPLLRGVLSGMGVEPSVVRNPFEALDQLRRRRYVGVVSDFELWAEGGTLLFQRLASSGARAPVLFICASPEGALKARAAGAAEVLERPLEPAGVAVAARIFAAHSAPPRSPAARSAHAEEAGRPGAEGPRAASPASLELRPEVAWLRFFFEARQAMRPRKPGEERLRALLQAFQSELAPGSSGVGVALPEGWWVLAQPGGEEPLRRIGRALREPEEESGPGLRAAPPEPVTEAERAGEEVVIPWAAGPHRAVFVALLNGSSQGPGAGRPVPEKYLQELSLLFSETGWPGP
jgi:CheY-like chemotaxis protein